MFITLEGIDGCGKSTQAVLMTQALQHAGKEVVSLREPGGVLISEKIRTLLLDPAHEGMSDICELLLYEAARAQVVHEAILPALEQGKTVICDRFYDSTTAYQAYAGGLDVAMVRQVNEIAVGSCRPDLTLVLDVPVELAATRATKRSAADRMEAKGLAYQARVAQGFCALAAQEPQRVKLIDAQGTVDEVHARVLTALHQVGVL